MNPKRIIQNPGNTTILGNKFSEKNATARFK